MYGALCTGSLICSMVRSGFVYGVCGDIWLRKAYGLMTYCYLFDEGYPGPDA